MNRNYLVLAIAALVPAVVLAQKVPEKEVCAAALATLLHTGADRRFERSAKEGVQDYFVFRSRKNPANSDACYVAGNRVMWRIESAEGINKGRWRIHPMDEKVSFVISGDKVTIVLEHADRTSTSESYSLKQLAKDMR